MYKFASETSEDEFNGRNMISIVITSFNEPENVKKAIQCILDNNIKEKYELLVVAPDKATEEIVKVFKKKHKQIVYFKDPGKGKSFALNLVFKVLKGDIWFFTDGDVYLGENSINEMLKIFEDKEVGCVSGRPVSINPRDNMLGFWSHLLYEAGAHKIRCELNNKNCFLECSGYLFAFRNDITKNIPLDVAEDSMVPYLATKKGYKVKYAENAFVYVKNPTNINDFIKQKVRTAKSHEALGEYAPFFPKVKSLKNEIKKGTFAALSYPKTIKESWWTILLFGVRAYIWLLEKLDERVLNKKYTDAWERIESTK
jgi:cellulose synthase/poly-beta-1,6-N-acetylglucosamine synthase-like glycosyltransferase